MFWVTTGPPVVFIGYRLYCIVCITDDEAFKDNEKVITHLRDQLYAKLYPTVSAFEKPDSIPKEGTPVIELQITTEITPEVTAEPQEDRTTDYTTIEPPAMHAKLTEAPSMETASTEASHPPNVAPSTAAPSAAPSTAAPVLSQATASLVESNSGQLSKLGEMENLIEQLNFQNQEIQIQLQNYKENSENWDFTKENFQTGIFMSVMIIFLCFLISKVCKLPYLGRLKLWNAPWNLTSYLDLFNYKYYINKLYQSVFLILFCRYSMRKCSLFANISTIDWNKSTVYKLWLRAT